MLILKHTFKGKNIHWISVLVIFSLWLAPEYAYSAQSEASNLELVAKYAELTKELNNNQFKRPLYMSSMESSDNLKGEIFAVVNYPFATVSQALNDPEHWCDVLILHINIKYCHAAINQNGTILSVNIGKKDDQSLADSYRMAFNYQEVTTTPNHFVIELNAEHGPFSTRDYRILLEAIPVKGERTFLHFNYVYGFGLTGSLAMQGYLATTGRNKVGFTITGQTADGKPKFIQGVRGIVERNTMRYYLAIDAYLAELNTPAQDLLEQRLQRWYSYTSQYASQLQEVERDDYLAMKRREYQRQQVVQ
jgi:hypothetical protein